MKNNIIILLTSLFIFSSCNEYIDNEFVEYRGIMQTETGQAFPDLALELFNRNDELIQTTTTELDGSFSFISPRLTNPTIRKPGYSFIYILEEVEIQSNSIEPPAPFKSISDIGTIITIEQ